MTSNQLGDANELARRFVACKGWRWLPGMLAQSEGQGVARVFHVATDGWISLCGGQPFASPFHTKTLPFPILSDAATRGAILELVREAWGDPYTHCQFVIAELNQPDCWMAIVDFGIGRREFVGRTEIESLLVALEAAP